MGKTRTSRRNIQPSKSFLLLLLVQAAFARSFSTSTLNKDSTFDFDSVGLGAVAFSSGAHETFSPQVLQCGINFPRGLVFL